MRNSAMLAGAAAAAAGCTPVSGGWASSRRLESGEKWQYCLNAALHVAPNVECKSQAHG